jgi:LuxR family transcriptional regulator, maltose regulon positive regulatory protein
MDALPQSDVAPHSACDAPKNSPDARGVFVLRQSVVIGSDAAGDLKPASTAPDLELVLLEAKLAVPSLRTAVSRADLIERVRATGCRVVGVTAPAGYGKTTFLAEWARTEERRVIWVSLDRFDDDPTRLLNLLAHAYRRVDPEGSDLVPEALGPGTSVLGRAAPRLAAVLHASTAPFVLMLDDLHELRSRACHDVLGVVLQGLPEGSQLVAASRGHQPHLPRLRVTGDAVDLAAADLAFDAAGARRVFASVRVELSPDLAAGVTERTEGWPAGLQLAAVMARENPGRVVLVHGADPYVADYLFHEALRGQPEDMRRFLRRTAVLDQMCGSLCDAVVGEPGGGERLAHLEASGVFVTPLDRRREWYRYHGLFRELLLSDLLRTEPNVAEDLHLRAAAWYDANGSPDQAIEHLLLTTDRARTAMAITRVIWPTYQARGLSTIMRWLSMLGDASIEGYPPLATLAGWGSLLTGDAIAAERWAAFVDAVEFDLPPGDGSASFASGRAMLRAAMCARGPEAMVSDAAFAVAQEPAWSTWRDSALWLLAEAHLLRGDEDEACELLADAAALATTWNHFETIAISESERAHVAMDRGDWDDAAVHLSLALAAIDERRMDDHALSPLAFAAAARLALHRGDLFGARAELTRAMRARPSTTYGLPFVAVRLRLRLARLYAALADATTAHHLLREVDDILRHRPALGSLLGELEQLRRDLGSTAARVIGPSPLSPAELRILPYLQTHLTLGEIAERNLVSRHTVRSQVASIYRKLGTTTRGEAVERATTMGLLGG